MASPPSPATASSRPVALASRGSPFNKVLCTAYHTSQEDVASHAAHQDEAVATHEGDYERQLVMRKRPWDM
jgi:hypothetical protein